MAVGNPDIRIVRVNAFRRVPARYFTEQPALEKKPSGNANNDEKERGREEASDEKTECHSNQQRCTGYHAPFRERKEQIVGAFMFLVIHGSAQFCWRSIVMISHLQTSYSRCRIGNSENTASAQCADSRLQGTQSI